MAKNKTATLKNLGSQQAQEVRIRRPIDKRKAAARQSYIVLLINRSTRCLKYGRINSGQWFAIPTVCQTCDRDFDWCFDHEKWAQVLTCNCRDAAFDLTLITEPDSDGNAWGATWRITPNCSYAGGVIGLQ